MLNTTSSTAAVDDDEDDEMHPPDGSKSLADAANAERVHRPNQALPLRTHAPTTTISNSRAGRQSSSWTVASSSSQMSPVHGQTVSMLVASQPQVALNQAPPETMTMQSATSSYIPRPPNAFILFRSSFIRSEKISGKVEGNHSTLSKIIGACLHLYSTRSYNTRVVFCKPLLTSTYLRNAMAEPTTTGAGRMGSKGCRRAGRTSETVSRLAVQTGSKRDGESSDSRQSQKEARQGTRKASQTGGCRRVSRS